MPHTIVAGIKKMQSALEKVKDDDLENPTSTALQVACAVVSVMEDDAAFNAGYGSMPNEDCNIEMDRFSFQNLFLLILAPKEIPSLSVALSWLISKLVTDIS